MPKAYGQITERLLGLAVGRSCVVDARRPDRHLATARKHQPDRVWSVEAVDSRKVVTRIR
ncbi:MAG: hypothetical protein Q8L66_08790 [Caulobacter sp.]|nr:hypothetical protein [Caulobacter sp.]